MKNALTVFAMLLTFAAFFAPKSYSQILGFYPQTDTILVVGGYTVPLITCSVYSSTSVRDSITVEPGWNTQMYMQDSTGNWQPITHGYFLVEDSLGIFEYMLQYFQINPWGPTLLVHFDSLFPCEAFVADLALSVIIGCIGFDWLAQPVKAEYGLPVEPGENPELLSRQPELRQNFPNPFNAATTISYRLPHAARVNVAVYDVAGQLVAALMDAPQSAGEHSLRWDAGGVNSGVYFIRLKAGEFVRVQQAILIR